MTDNVRVAYGEDRGKTATLLLAAAEETEGYEADAVQVSSYGGFLVPEEIAKAAGLDYEEEGAAMGHVYSEDEVAEAEKSGVETPDGFDEETQTGYKAPEGDDEPAKKTAKKTTAKKTAKKAGA